MMKRVIAAMIVALTAATANAYVTGEWTVEEGVAAGLDRWTLTVTTSHGNITGFDIAVWTVDDVLNQTAGVFSPAVDLDTHFLFQTDHMVPNPDPPPPPEIKVTDITKAQVSEGASWLQAAAAFTRGGIYEGGAASYDVLQLVLSDTFETDPMDLYVFDSAWTGVPVAKIKPPEGAEYLEEIFGLIPEPAMLSLLGVGALALLRRRSGQVLRRRSRS